MYYVRHHCSLLLFDMIRDWVTCQDVGTTFIGSKASFRQCSCWPPESSEHVLNFTTFPITISYTFQYKIVLKIFKVSGQFGKRQKNNNQTMAYGLERTRTLPWECILKFKTCSLWPQNTVNNIKRGTCIVNG